MEIRSLGLNGVADSSDHPLFAILQERGPSLTANGYFELRKSNLTAVSAAS
jgi:hypothetical protein